MGLSAFAIVLGVAFVAGTFVFTDTLSSSFTDLFRQTAPDVTVRPAQAAAAASGGFTGGDLGSRTVPADARRRAGRGARARTGPTATSPTRAPTSSARTARSSAAAAAPRGSAATTTTPRPPTDPRSSPSPRALRRAAPGELVIDDKSAATAGYQHRRHRPAGHHRRAAVGHRRPWSAPRRFGESGNLIGATSHCSTPRRRSSCTSGGPTCSTTSRHRRRPDRPRRSCATRSPRPCPPDFEAVDDEQIAAENQDQLEQGLSFITTFLLVFAAVALVVGTFLILNTFSIIVAQRTRELALFRALGASKAPGHPVGAARGAGRRPGRLDRRPGPRLRAGGRAARRCSAAIGLDLGEAGWSSSRGRHRRLRRRCAGHAAGRLPAGPQGGQGAAGRRDARRRLDPRVVDAPAAARRRGADRRSAPG